MNNELLSGISDLLDKKLEPIDTKLDSIETQTKENTDMIKALRHSSEVNKATLDKMNIDIAYIKGNVESIKKDICNVELITASNWADIAKIKAIK
ncbi:MAG: hypothetical protein RSC84_03320 [Peptostreptococcaceae bacterium]